MVALKSKSDSITKKPHYYMCNTVYHGDIINVFKWFIKMCDPRDFEIIDDLKNISEYFVYTKVVLDSYIILSLRVWN